MIMFFLYISHWHRKIVVAKMSAQQSERYSLAPNQADGLKPNIEYVLTMTAESTNAANALVPMMLNGLNTLP